MKLCRLSGVKFHAMSLVALALIANTASAQNNWNVASGNFGVGSNWDVGAVPGVIDEAFINNGGVATLSSGDFRMESLSVASASATTGTFNMTGGAIRASTYRFGESGTTTSSISGGSLLADSALFVGPNNGSGIGTLNISGSSTRVQSNDDFGVGRQGNGIVNQSGGEARAPFLFIGKYGTGVWNHSGGLLRQTGGDLEIGDGGNPSQTGNIGPRNGSMNITGGVVHVGGNFAIGNRSGTGTVNISGGALAVTGSDGGGSNIYVGRGMDWGTPGAGGPVEMRVTGGNAIIVGAGDFLMNPTQIASSSTLVAEITGTAHTTIRVAGNADITNGKLKVDLTGYNPVSGNSWTLLTAGADISAAVTTIDNMVAAGGFDQLAHAVPNTPGTLMGTFASTDFSLAPLTSGLSWNVSYANNSVTLSVTGTAIPTFTADFNKDGKVDGLDLTKWKSDYGVNANSDANGDLKSDGADFLAWQRQFGSGVPASPIVAAVPEPSSVILFAGAMVSLIARRRRSA
ncbi:hypothetical protein PLANPX_5632 [Lacipirellula parvula]|uniref:Ice-binding protein C-terminal domain-containing protein n=2 Tax=Lacipirellula parvula TaxID=2650471 RepID=A0A5K7XGN6_9BACT|nr:hypothetical protein PLANPX_5632 [Lacipirellula parvula]